MYRYSKHRISLWVAVLALACSGCASGWVKQRDVPQSPLAVRLRLGSDDGPRVTERSRLLLRRYDLEDKFEDRPHELLTRLGQIVKRNPSPEAAHALAEVAYVEAKKIEKDDPAAALHLHGAAVAFAYRYLFDPRYDGDRNPYDPQFRSAGDLYNGALEDTLRIVQTHGKLRPGKSYTVEVCGQTWHVAVELRDAHWRADEIDHFKFVSDYDVTGLRNHYRTHGLGVPLIAVRRKDARNQAANNAAIDVSERYYPPDLTFAVTAFLRIAPRQDGRPGVNRAVLEIYDPLTTTDIVVAGRHVPLESDITTPLAYFLNQPTFDDMELATKGLLFPDQAQKIRGLYMIAPYDPAKIPVIMIHGLWSSPITWMEMFNDLRGSREIRENYQFWFYLYPTGQPFWISASQMRDDLAQLRDTLDPRRTAPALDQMVLVGHSMGGLVGKMQMVDSGDDVWRLVSDRPLDDVKASAEVRASLAKTYFFRPNPSIRRLVTIATPHAGSKAANSTTQWLGRKLIALPKMLTRTRSELHRDNPGVFRASSLIDVSTSVDSLLPESPILPVLAKAPHLPGVRYHNIIGLVPDEGIVGRVVGGSDGVVSRESAHLEGAASEVFVTAHHKNIHSQPRTVLEVQRILLEHLDELRRGSAPRQEIETVGHEYGERRPSGRW
ncbi:MAG: alpha/beta hydrolase [Planctomycetes bacterium]|nr:alpha/beta hydrolase [Planctomycetota bacterium]